MKPLYEQSFRLRAEPNWDGVPKNNTPNINALLNQIKQDVRYTSTQMNDEADE